MDALTVTGTSESGEHLLVSAPDGTEYRLPVDEVLRNALRRAAAAGRPGKEPVDLRPRQIQALLRSGYSVDEVVVEHNLPRERVEPFEPPVLAERTFVAQQARQQRVGHDSDSPTLGDLVVDRLAARGVDVDDLTWNARRAPGESWEVGVTFVAAHKERTAIWKVDLQARTLVAADDEARWLSETDVSPGRRHLNAVDGPLGSTRRRGTEPPWVRDSSRTAATPAGAVTPDESTEHSPVDPADLPTDHGEPEKEMTEALLDDLAANRGTRQDIDDLQDELDLDALTGPDGDGIPAAHPPASQPGEARDAQVLSLDAHRRTRPTDGPDADEEAFDPRGTHPSVRGRSGRTAADEATKTRDEQAQDKARDEKGADSPGAARGTDDSAPTSTAERSPRGRDGTGSRTGDSAEPRTADAPTDAGSSDVDTSSSNDHSSTDDSSGAGTPADDDAAAKDSKPAAPAEPPPAKKPARSSKRQRRSVPSWDEIVFGSRSDSD